MSDDRTRLEHAIAAATAGRDRLLDTQLFGQGVLDAGGRLLRCTDTFARIFGYADAAEAVAREADRPFPPLAGREAVDERLTRDRRIDRLEGRLRRADGCAIHVIESARIISSPAGTDEIEHTVIDVTAFMTMADRLRQSRRLEEVGTLAASMTPEIVRVLAEIERDAHLLADATPPADARPAADAIVDRAAAAGELGRQLLAFSRRQGRPPDNVDLHVVVARGEALWRRLIGSHLGFEMKFGARAPIAANADDLDQLITAMVVAARDVLPVGGKVLVETDRVELDANDIAGLEDATPGPRAVLAVTSTGFGVEHPTMPPVASVLARRSGAFVRTSAEPGRSASFEVYFPSLG
ncbi:MAG TPA: hypothetical protein VFO19_18855 [Vicinamibacterales bacterium]|nr:hypothetical protein [Vicinamibacterales bacterium]